MGEWRTSIIGRLCTSFFFMNPQTAIGALIAG
jgi:hypothetical protein